MIETYYTYGYLGPFGRMIPFICAEVQEMVVLSDGFFGIIGAFCKFLLPKIIRHP